MTNINLLEYICVAYTGCSIVPFVLIFIYNLNESWKKKKELTALQLEFSLAIIIHQSKNR